MLVVELNLFVTLGELATKTFDWVPFGCISKN
jgi:hypothetical protein